MAKRKEHTTTGIYKNTRYNCKYCVPSDDVSKEFDGCSSPVCIWKNRFKHLFVLACPPEGEACLYIRKQDPADIDLIEKYIQKYSQDGYLFITNKHRANLCERIRFRNAVDQQGYLRALLLHHGWRESIEQDDKDNGTFYTNLKEKAEVKSLDELTEELKKKAPEKKRRRRSTKKEK